MRKKSLCVGRVKFESRTEQEVRVFCLQATQLAWCLRIEFKLILPFRWWYRGATGTEVIGRLEPGNGKTS